MVGRLSKEKICRDLKNELAKGRTLFIAGVGSGISAKFSEAGGSDLISTYPIAKFRMQGHSSGVGYFPICDSNLMVLEMGEREILPVVKKTPVIAGLFGADPTRDMNKLLDKVIAVGFSGILNCPTLSRVDGNFGKGLAERGIHYNKEIEMMTLANKKGLFTMAFASNCVETEKMLSAECDLIIAHLGGTVGGTTGAKSSLPFKDMIKRIQEICDITKKIKPKVFFAVHGGSISTPKDFLEILQNTRNVDGYMGGSTAERLPVETSIKEAVEAFKKIKLLTKKE